MAEWPKWLGYHFGPVDPAEVIPADLGRELYEALKATYQDGPCPQRQAALDRYEREVKDD